MPSTPNRQSLPEDPYDRIFQRFDRNNGAFVPTWNWAAFLLGGIWYLAKGIWPKGLVIILIALFSVGVGIPLLWLYCAVFGNWDYYLVRRAGTQGWSPGIFQRSVSSLSGRTKRCPYCAEFIQELAKVCRYCGRDLPKK